MKIRYLFIIFSLLLITKVEARTEFISHDLREKAQLTSREGLTYYKEGVFQHEIGGKTQIYTTKVDFPYYWIERTIFFHCEGLPQMDIYVNGEFLGSANDSKQIAEFNLSPKLKEGINEIRVEYAPNPELEKFEAIGGKFKMQNSFFYSQPALRIEDYIANFINDTLELKVVINNTLDHTQKLSVGYDIFTPTAQLDYYNLREITMAANSIDTLIFRDKINTLKQYPWRNEHPNLYNTTIYIRENGIIKEYVGFKIGYKNFTVDKNFDFAAKKYNSAQNRKQTLSELKNIKTQNFKTIIPDYPQPYWFYDICDELGLYVIEGVNLNSSEQRENLKIGGTPSNNLDYLPLYLERTEKMYSRSKNRTCIIAFSLGGMCGNGINMYRTYKLLKQLEKNRPILYPDTQGAWNSDFEFPNYK